MWLWKDQDSNKGQETNNRCEGLMKPGSGQQNLTGSELEKRGADSNRGQKGPGETVYWELRELVVSGNKKKLKAFNALLEGQIRWLVALEIRWLLETL